MKAMLRLCTVLLGVTAAWAAVVPLKDFNPEEMEGKWYIIGFATNAEWFTRRKDSMKMGTATVQKTTDGDLDMSCSIIKDDGSCWKMQHILKKTNTPGHYTYYSERWRSNNDVHVVEAKADEYTIMHTVKTKAGQTDQLTKLYGRTKDLSDEVKNTFKKFSLEVGILPENIVLLPPNGECQDS